MRTSKLKIALVLVGVFLMFWHLVALPYMKANPRQRIKPPVLVEFDYGGFNIVKFKGLYWGVDQREGAIDVSQLEAKAQFAWVSSADLKEVKVKLDQLQTEKKIVESIDLYGPPVLVEVDYGGFNIVKFKGLYWGVDQREGAIDVSQFEAKAQFAWVSSADLKKVKVKLDQLQTEKKIVESIDLYGPPVLVEVDYGGFNIVKFKGLYWGVDQREGAIDVSQLEAKAQFAWVSSADLKKVKVKLDQLQTEKKIVESIDLDGPPVLVEKGYKGYNIVKFQGEFYGVSQGEGPIDVEEIQDKAKLPWFKSVNLGNVHKNIDILADQIAKQNKRSFWEKVVGKVLRILDVIVD